MKWLGPRIKMKLLAGLLACNVSGAASAQDIVLAFDSVLAPASSLDGMARTKMLINSLIRVDVAQVMLLVQTADINAKTLERLSYYNDSGQLLVNAGHHYSIYHRQSNYAYPVDIMKANGILEAYSHYQRHIYFPYLYEGGEAVKLEKLREFLSANNYRASYVTTRVNDDYMDSLYQQRLRNNRTVDIHSLEKAYAKMVVASVLSYDAKAHLMLGFSPRQVLLLHANDLAAYCITEVVDQLRAKGFNVVSPEKVFTDPVVNPYFVSGYSTVSYMPYLTGLSEPYLTRPYVLSQAEKSQVQEYLREQGINDLTAE